MKGGERVGRILYHAQRYVVLFLMISFVVTCCMMLFVSSMAQAMEVTLTGEHIEQAAKLTFFNVMLISTLFTIADSLRHKWMVERQVRQIVRAAERIMQGDFSVRIPPLHGAYAQEGLGDIAQCFNRMAQELSGTETLRTDFIANVSHELKTPLAVIKNYAAMLDDDAITPEKRREYARAIADTTSSLAKLITDILRLNKLENQQIYPASEPYDLGEQLCECLLGFEETWEKKRLQIETQIQEDVWVSSDASLLSLVWNNLFSNAVKFTPEEGTISLRLKTEGDRAVVEVTDTGCGFDAQVGAHIFEKFYQGDASRATQGNGLGLALVRRVIDIIGGDIAVQSEIGRGSTFTVRLACVQRETEHYGNEADES